MNYRDWLFYQMPEKYSSSLQFSSNCLMILKTTNKTGFKNANAMYQELFGLFDFALMFSIN